MRIELTFSYDEMKKLARAEYVRLFGEVPPGYNWSATDYYGDMTVTVAPCPEPQAPLTPVDIASDPCGTVSDGILANAAE